MTLRQCLWVQIRNQQRYDCLNVCKVPMSSEICSMSWLQHIKKIDRSLHENMFQSGMSLTIIMAWIGSQCNLMKVGEFFTLNHNMA